MVFEVFMSGDSRSISSKISSFGFTSGSELLSCESCVSFACFVMTVFFEFDDVSNSSSVKSYFLLSTSEV